MKKLLIILLFLISLAGNATNYYIKANGRDEDAGRSDLTAWGSIAKVNAEWLAGTFAPGDSILFNKGDTFYGTIVVKESGSSGNAITISSYGVGSKPIITGFTTIASNSWIDNGDGRYYTSITINQRAFVVLVDGIMKGMGRFPDEGTNMTYESFTNSPRSITDNTLGEGVNWEGAELVVNILDYSRGRGLIVDHTSNTLTYTNVTQAVNHETANRNYFIQNDLRCLTETDEWYHDLRANRLYVYGNPSAKEVKVATLTSLLINGYNYIAVDGITFTGSIGNGIDNLYTNQMIVRNCNITYAGKMGISMKGANALIEHNIIEYVNDWGIYGENNNITIANNKISYVGLILGLSTSVSGQGIVLSGNANNITNVGYNDIRYTAYNGIHARGICNIHHNFFYHVCENLTDGGAVYIGGERPEIRYIEHNIVLYSGGRGIYIDEPVSNVHINYNVVAYCLSSSGYHIHKGHNNKHTYNTSFDCQYGIWYQDPGGLLTYDNISQNNKYISKTPSQVSLFVTSGLNNLTDFFSVADGNYYARPIDVTPTIRAYQPNFSGYQNYTIPQWKAFMSPLDADANNNLGGAVASGDDMHFIYNNTESNQLYVVSTIMKDVANASYSGIITLEPYTALVLLGVGTVTLQTNEQEAEEGMVIFFSGGTVMANDSTKVTLKTGKMQIRQGQIIIK